MHISKLTCPHCQSPYPLWRVLIRCRSHVCPRCKSKLAFTIESAQRLGATGGLIGAVILVPIILICGPNIIHSWVFWLFLVVFSYVAGGVIRAFVCRFAPYEQVRASAKRWELFANVSPRHRQFLLLGFSVLLAYMILALFARYWPILIWLVAGMSPVVMVAGILSSIAGWHWLFGERGILRRGSSDDAD